MLHILRRACLLTLALILAFLGFVQFQMHLLRHRAERLHAEILDLHLRQGTFGDIQQMQREWGSFAHYDGPCTQIRCDYEILLSDIGTSLAMKNQPTVAGSKLVFRWVDGVEAITPPLMRLYRILGGRPVSAYATIKLHENRIWSTDYGINLWAYPGVGRNEGQAYIVAAEVISSPRILTSFEFNPSLLKQGYRTSHTLSCAGCELVVAAFTPQTAPDFIQRINRFNFACITQMKTCRDPSDLAPDLWRVAVDDKASFMGEDESNKQFCDLPTAVLAREANDILLVEVLTAHPVHDPNTQEEIQQGTLRVVEKLKNGDSTPLGTILKYSNSPMAVRLTDSGQTGFVAGEQYYFLYRHPKANELDSRIGLRPCHGLLNTPANRSEVKAGIALDGSDADAM